MVTATSPASARTDALLPAPFGRVLTAMVTPMHESGEVDLDGAARLAVALLEAGNDGLVLNGTTGESPTTTRAEKAAVVRAVRAAAGDGVPLLSGVGTNDTASSAALAREAAEAGADGLLLVSPYYSRPTQEGLVAHVERVASATDLPVMLYDIPGRTGVPFSTETLIQLGAHPNVVAVKDAKDDLAATGRVLAATDLAYYSGTDALNLPLLAIGGVGVVSVVSHVVTAQLGEMIAALNAGDVAGARSANRALQPVYEGMFRAPGVVTAKAALAMLGLPAGPVRMPLVGLGDEQRARLRSDLELGGVKLP
jgi:4-hydroxy-tetrahydrodipicolinate synthase